MNISTTLKRFGLEKAFDYLYKDPETNLLKIMHWADKFSGGEFEGQRKSFVKRWKTPTIPIIPISVI